MCQGQSTDFSTCLKSIHSRTPQTTANQACHVPDQPQVAFLCFLLHYLLVLTPTPDEILANAPSIVTGQRWLGNGK